MIYFYRFFYFLLKITLLILKPFLSVKYKIWIKLRAKKIDPLHQFNDVYWFHAASGEIEYCKSVIRLLKEKKPKAQIVVTYSSPSAEKLFHNVRPYIDQFIPLCWDQPLPLKNLIDYINPKVLVFSRTDLWPELIIQAKKRKIKIGVISFNPRHNSLSKFVQKWLLPKFNFISCVNDDIKHYLDSAFKLDTVTSSGDTRFDQVFYRLSQEVKLKIQTENKIFVCGSTWPEDEDILFKSFPELLKNNFKIILSPHEVQFDNISRLEKELKNRGFTYQLLSKEYDLLQIILNKDVLIVDNIGYLADVYRFANLAFVGGAFKHKVHSVMEPLCCGLPVITGPYYKNNPEAVKYYNQYVFMAMTPEDVVKIARNLQTFSQAQIINEMHKNKLASKKVLDIILHDI